MKVRFTKKCYVGGVLRDRGEVADIADAGKYGEVCQVIEAPAPAPEKKAPEAKPKADTKTKGFKR